MCKFISINTQGLMALSVKGPQVSLDKDMRQKP